MAVTVANATRDNSGVQQREARYCVNRMYTTELCC